MVVVGGLGGKGRPVCVHGGGGGGGDMYLYKYTL